MALKQVCVFIENKKGKISEISDLLYSNGVDLRGLNMSDTKEFAILRLITKETDKTCEVLKNAGYVSAVKNVAAVKIEDKPGGMFKALKILSDSGISIEYTYLIKNTDGDSYMILRTQSAENTEKLLSDAGFTTLSYE